jgi:hypothetical protein
MADSSVTNGPESPEHPLNISVDGDLGAVEFVRRLHRGGLALQLNANDGSTVITRSEREPQPVSGVRTQLFQVTGILHAVRCVLDSDAPSDLDESLLAYALEAAGKIIDDVAGQLEGQES